MSELVTTRIRATAAKLGLPHLAGTLTDYVQRAASPARATAARAARNSPPGRAPSGQPAPGRR